MVDGMVHACGSLLPAWPTTSTTIGWCCSKPVIRFALVFKFSDLHHSSSSRMLFYAARNCTPYIHHTRHGVTCFGFHSCDRIRSKCTVRDYLFRLCPNFGQHPPFFWKMRTFSIKIGHVGTILFAIPRGTNVAEFWVASLKKFFFQ
jgi:hypothetical protein